jgi:predicted transcriptional regulator
MKLPKTPMSLSLDSELNIELRRISDVTGIPMTRLIEDALINYLPSIREAHADQLVVLARAAH